MSDARGTALGNPRVHHRRIDSTNELARELAQRGADHGTLVTASEQTAGRGRHGREWWSPPGDSLLMSLILREPPSLLPLAAPLAVRDAVLELADIDPLIKWPNDIVVADAAGSSLTKLAGILVEGRPEHDWVVLGIGVNVAVAPSAIPPQLRGTVATLGLPRTSVEPLLDALLRALERRLAEPDELVLEAWRARDALLGREIVWVTAAGTPAESSRARAQGIDGAGRLVVSSGDGSRQALEAGEIHLAPASTRERAGA